MTAHVLQPVPAAQLLGEGDEVHRQALASQGEGGLPYPLMSIQVEIFGTDDLRQVGDHLVVAQHRAEDALLGLAVDVVASNQEEFPLRAVPPRGRISRQDAASRGQPSLRTAAPAASRVLVVGLSCGWRVRHLGPCQ